jgi:hypothetical protein
MFNEGKKNTIHVLSTVQKAKGTRLKYICMDRYNFLNIIYYYNKVYTVYNKRGDRGWGGGGERERERFV